MGNQLVKLDPEVLRPKLTKIKDSAELITSMCNLFNETAIESHKKSNGAPFTYRLKEGAEKNFAASKEIQKNVEAITEDLNKAIKQYEETIA